MTGNHRACRPARRARRPSEEAEQRALAQILDLARLDWWHTPNGGARSRAEAGVFRALGVKAGIPDVIILTAAPGAPRGAAIELKRADGRPSDVSEAQRDWLTCFRTAGFAASVAFGWIEAVEQLRALGYPLPAVGRSAA